MVAQQNPELLAFSQDSTIGSPAKPFGSQSTSPPEFYSGTSTKGTHVFVLNTADVSANKTVTFADVPGLEAGTGYVVHDMWTGSDVGTFMDVFSVLVEAHDTAAWLVTPA
jgi:alpha-galactosidase